MKPSVSARGGSGASTGMRLQRHAELDAERPTVKQYVQQTKRSRDEEWGGVPEGLGR